MAGVITGGLELELARHALVGVQGWGGIFGEPGDTEGEIQSALFYVGLRF
ncbi:MAG: hypothetical protein JNL08_02925 [Planctomycetes bacterium]|nr:hypothetical protein [Planctomycetota bacterium]